MPIPLSFSQKELNDTIREIKTLKVSQLRSLVRSLVLPNAGTRDVLLGKVALFFEDKWNVDEAARLAAIRNLIELIKNNGSIPTYNDVYNYYRSRDRSRPGTPSSFPPAMHSRDSNPVRDHKINFIDNPFFRLVRKLHISPQVCRPCKRKGVLEINFVFDEIEHKLLRREDSNMKIYLLCGRKMEEGLVSHDVEIEWPIPHELYVNDEKMLNNYEGIRHKPGTAKPVDVTDFVLGPPKLNKIRMTYEDDTDTYYVYLYFVILIPIEEVIEEIKEHPKISKRGTMDLIKKNADDSHLEGIEIKDIMLTLKDPYTFTRIQTPIKTMECDHLECFDLNFFMIQQQSNPTWECPHCGNSLEVSDLAICEYFEDILNNVSMDVDYARITNDGQWAPVIESVYPRARVKSKKHKSQKIVEEPQIKVKLESGIREGAFLEEIVLSSDDSDQYDNNDSTNRNDITNRKVQELLAVTDPMRREDSLPTNGQPKVQPGINLETLKEPFGETSVENQGHVYSKEIASVGEVVPKRARQDLTSPSTNSSLVTCGLDSAQTSPRDDHVSIKFQRHQMSCQRTRDFRLHEQQLREQQRECQNATIDALNEVTQHGPVDSRQQPAHNEGTQNTTPQAHPIRNPLTKSPFAGPASLGEIEEQFRSAIIAPRNARQSTPGAATESLEGGARRYAQQQIAIKMSQPQQQQQQQQRQHQQQQRESTSNSVAVDMLTRDQRSTQHIKLEQGSHRKVCNAKSADRATDCHKTQNSSQPIDSLDDIDRFPLAAGLLAYGSVSPNSDPKATAAAVSKESLPVTEQKADYPLAESSKTKSRASGCTVALLSTQNARASSKNLGKSSVGDIVSNNPKLRDIPNKRSQKLKHNDIAISKPANVNGGDSSTHVNLEDGSLHDQAKSSARQPIGLRSSSRSQSRSAHDKLQKQYSSLFIRNKRPPPSSKQPAMGKGKGKGKGKRTDPSQGKETALSVLEEVHGSANQDGTSRESTEQLHGSETHKESDVDYLFVEDDEDVFISDAENSNLPTTTTTTTTTTTQEEQMQANKDLQNETNIHTSVQQRGHLFSPGEAELEKHITRQMRSQPVGDIASTEKLALEASIEKAAFTQLEQLMASFETDTKRTLEDIKLKYASNPERRNAMLEHNANSREKERRKVIDVFVSD
ncbi:hypothetical protein KGF57_001374 [Candida theae]|uniref:SP-RING-type domain-containing protein n=1 Tax=Candida theae TaxID=1198502 RepID=A0AAD5FZY3_9ASCO|nr:uncharacterized protein KGF57_001374 [Candida theae]KAI5962805.1 hypothetical protein KGF57_001374 [Candida theae]